MCSKPQFLVCKGISGLEFFKQMLKIFFPPLVITILERQKNKKVECLQKIKVTASNYHENNGHEKCVVFQGTNTLLKEVNHIIQGTTVLNGHREGKHTKILSLLKNSAFVSDGGLQMGAPH